MIDKIKDNVLFKGLTADEIQMCLKCSKAKLKEYKKNQIVFSQMDPPVSLYVLINGSVSVCKDSPDGRRYIVTNIEEGDIFGEVYVFLKQAEYSYYVVSNMDSTVLAIPKEYFFHTCNNACNAHSVIIQNMLGILAYKAYFLNNKVQLLTSGSLRQKIVKYLLDNCKDKNFVKLSMNREQFAAYLNVTRPSLSRELIHMQEDGLIKVDRDVIQILDMDKLSSAI
ncbi:MAG: cAMP-binding domain of CRP or a regulatory subunit of cAMP-dependent protein kinases [Lachnoclostridium sp.]|jgi:CRP/FNR family transcriptional regulator, dissimilatory nitrate respiration regulator